MTTPTAPGLYPDIPFTTYCAIDAVNISSLGHMAISAKYFHHCELHPRSDSDAFRLGRTYHALLLEPETLATDFAIFAGATTGTKAYREFAELHPERTCITEGQLDLAQRMAAETRAHPLVRELLDACEDRELTMIWDDPITGLRCKGRIDLLGPDVLCCLKSTRHLLPRLFWRDCADLDYPAKLAWYRWGVEVLTGTTRAARLIVCTSGDVVDCTVQPMPVDALLYAQGKTRAWLDRLAQCRETGAYPGVALDAELPVELPRWYFPSDWDFDRFDLDGQD